MQMLFDVQYTTPRRTNNIIEFGKISYEIYITSFSQMLVSTVCHRLTTTSLFLGELDRRAKSLKHIDRRQPHLRIELVDVTRQVQQAQERSRLVARYETHQVTSMSNSTVR